MRGVMYDKDGERSTGVIAQEMQQVMPEVVQEGEYLSVAALPSVIVLPCVDDVPTTVKLPSTCTLAPDIVSAAVDELPKLFCWFHLDPLQNAVL